MEETLSFIGGIIFYLFLILFLIRHFTKVSSIKKNSKLFDEVKNLNNLYVSSFQTIRNKYTFRYTRNSLQQYKNSCNKTAIINFMCGIVRENETEWLELYNYLNKNRSTFNKYLEEYQTLKKVHGGKSYLEVKKKTFLLSEKQYLKAEEKICYKGLLKPITTLEIKIKVSYTSPGGRNNYATDYTLTNDSIDEVFTRLTDRKESERSIDYQRALMTSGKRYDILRRDKYKCQICGRTQSDGAKLEIDHIIPVSKGGKTVDENLQTLCYECNRGKKAKM